MRLHSFHPSLTVEPLLIVAPSRPTLPTSAIPVFNSLIGIIGSVFGTLLTMHLMVRRACLASDPKYLCAVLTRCSTIQGACYLYDNWHLRFVDKSARFRILFVWKCVCPGTEICLLPPFR